MGTPGTQISTSSIKVYASPWLGVDIKESWQKLKPIWQAGPLYFLTSRKNFSASPSISCGHTDTALNFDLAYSVITVSRSSSSAAARFLTFQLTPGCRGDLPTVILNQTIPELRIMCHIQPALLGKTQLSSSNQAVPVKSRKLRDWMFTPRSFGSGFLTFFIFYTLSIAQTYLQPITNSKAGRGYWWSMECSGIITEIRHSSHHRHLGSIIALLLLQWFLLII